MKVFNARDPQAIGYIEKHLTPDGEYDLPSYVEMLKNVLTYSRDDVFLPILIDGDEVLGFIIALAAPNQQHVWIIQTYFSEKLTDNKRHDQLFIKLILWSLQKGRRSIRGETLHGSSSKEQFRSWDFKPYSKIMSYDIGDDFEERILAQRVKTENSVTATTPPETKNPKPKKLESEVFVKKGKKDVAI